MPYALYINRHYLGASEREIGTDDLPTDVWATAEASDLLDRSEARLQALEAKGPGLATVCAIVAAAVAVAISLDWSHSTFGGKVILVVAGLCGAMSLWTPVVLVGPIRRETVTAVTLRHASEQDDPQGALALAKAAAAASNDLATQRLSNLQAASRNDARNSILVFVLWGVLALTGAVQAARIAHHPCRGAHHQSSRCQER